MKTTQLSSSTGLKACYHCGDDCDHEQIRVDDHVFCCEGCKLVYELLRENNMCSYYAISKAPGNSGKAGVHSETFTALDEPGIREKVILFEDEHRSRAVFHVPVMHCSSCIWLLEHLGKLNPAIISSTVNFPRREVTVDFKTDGVRLSEVAGLLAATGYAPSISLGSLEAKPKRALFDPAVLKIGVAGFCFGNIMLLSFPEYLGAGDLAEVPKLRLFFAWLSLGLALPVLLYCASGFFVSAWKAIRFRTLNIDAPIALAIAVTFLRSAYEIIAGGGTSYLDSMSGIVFFMLIGRYFQDRTYRSMSFERDYKSYFPIAVTAIRNNVEESTAVTNLRKGDRIVIRSHELIPADSILLSERCYVDYSFVTGESEPVRCVKGQKIFAGARQTSGACELEVLTGTSQSYLTQLWNNDAFTRKKKEERKTYIDRINEWFTVLVLLVAGTAALAWSFTDSATALNVLTAVLIVACPCTLLLASLFTNGSVMHWLGKKHFYLKNADVIERLATADTIVFDKTGTITSHDDGEVRFDGEPLTPHELGAVLNLAGQSGHPLSRRIVAAFPYRTSGGRITAVNEIAGKGIRGMINGQVYALGSAGFTGKTGTDSQRTEVWVAIDGVVRGKFLFTNKFREGLDHLAFHLKPHFRLELLSGDNDAERKRLEPVFGESMFFFQDPEQKLQHIRALQASGRKVIMVGDGLNDAGALMQADAGIAVSDNLNNFFPACDAILDGKMFNGLAALLSFTRVARRVLTVTFIVSVIYNLAGIYFAVRGELSPLVAAVLMPASTFTVIAITTLSVRIAASRKLPQTIL